MPQNFTAQPYKIQVAYLGNSPSLYNSTVFAKSNPYAPNASRSDRAFQYKAAYARPDSPLEAGVYGAVESYILATGYIHPADSYNVAGLYAQRDPVKSFPGVFVFYQQTHDKNVGPGAPADAATTAARRAFAVVFDEVFLGEEVMVGLRPVEYALFEFGFGAASNAPYGQPTWRASVKSAGPFFRAGPSAAASPMTSPAAPPTQKGPTASVALSADKQVDTANCAICHNTDGTSGVGPNLHQIATTKTLAQTIEFIEAPAGAIKKYIPARCPNPKSRKLPHLSEQRSINMPADIEFRSASALARRCPALFRGVSFSAIEALALRMELQSYRHRAEIFRAGDEAANFFVITGGHVRVSRPAACGQPVGLDLCGAGDVLGESTLFVSREAFDAIAVGPVSVWCFSTADIRCTVGEEAAFGMNVATLLHNRVGRLFEALEDVACSPVSQRLLSFFERLAQAHGTKVASGRSVGVHLTHTDIASFIGSTRETVSSLMASLKRSGVLVADGKRLIIADSVNSLTLH